MVTNIYGKDWERECQRRLSKFSGKTHELLSDYIKYKRETNGIKFQRALKLLVNIGTFLKRQKIDDISKTAETDVKAFFEILEKESKSSETQLDYRVVLGGFFKWHHGIKQNILPPELQFLEGRKFKQVKKTGSVLMEDDARKMIDNSLRLQHKAFISLLWFTGGRVGEILPLKRREIEVVDEAKQQYRIYIPPEGKTGAREILIVDKWGYVGQYLHEFKGDANSLIFATRNGKASYMWFRKMLTETARRAGITKKVNPHWFRHSAATALANAGMTGLIMSPYLGWVAGSDMPSRYLHMSGRSADKFISAMAEKNSDEFIRSNLGRLDNTSSKEKEKLYSEMGEYFMQKYMPIIVQRTIQGLQELESYRSHLTRKRLMAQIMQ